jgi:hypothetical protein
MFLIVMAWLGHAIHVFPAKLQQETWMPGLPRPTGPDLLRPFR